MKIFHLSIRNFRGIRELDWKVQGSVNCLIGPGDSTKSTILDAIELALSPRWSVPFTDVDFYLGQVDEPIEIIVTIGQLPEKFFDINKYGSHLRGWSTQDGIHDEPEADDEIVISLALQVDESLEPSWLILTDRNPDGTRISSRDRELLGMTRLGPYVDRHLSWSRGSALSHLTGDLDSIPNILTDVGRKARESVTTTKIETLEDAAKRAQESALRFGVKPMVGYRPGLDAQLSIGGSTALSLHDGDIPTRLAGLGSRRLLALSIQHSCIQSGSFLLVDEVEQALEPHRLRHVIRILRPPEPDDGTSNQTFMTTHSSISIVELNAFELCVVRSANGHTTVQQVDISLQGTMRKTPEALLGQKIIVCEGNTEHGVCRAFDRAWSAEPDGVPWAFIGVVPVVPTSGGGSQSPKIALELAKLGYPVSFLCDSDIEFTPDETELRKNRVLVIQWAENSSIEQRICNDLPISVLDEIVDLAVECSDSQNRQSILDAIGSRLELQSGQLKGEISDWTGRDFQEGEIREAIGISAKSTGWFKRTNRGEKLGELIYPHLATIPDSDLAIKFRELKEWVNG